MTRWTQAELSRARSEVTNLKALIQASDGVQAEARQALQAMPRNKTARQRELAAQHPKLTANLAGMRAEATRVVALYEALVDDKCSYCQTPVLGAERCVNCGAATGWSPDRDADARQAFLGVPR